MANKIAVTFLSFSTAIFLSGASLTVPLVANAALSESQIQSILQLLQSFGADAATINNVNASLRGQPTTTPPAQTGNCNFTRSLTVGSTGSDVTCLQQYLNSSGFTVAASGAGSPGNETTYFGPLTRTAVGKWQQNYGITPAAGYFGPISRAKYVSLVSGGTTPTPIPTDGATPTPTIVGTGLMISAGTQPANHIAPGAAARVPFTVFKLTASNDGDITVNGVTVERGGPAADGAFIGVTLVDENGTQIGIAKTLNSTHQAVVGDPFVVKAGQTRTLTIGGNMDTKTNLADDAGNVATFSVIGINTAATVSGSLPITGAAHTINAALTIGSVTTSRGSLDPGASQTKNVGTTGYTFSSVKITAGSAEKVYLSSIRWNQTGSVGTADLANVKTYVDGTAYDTVVSSDGKYYTSTFPGNGILVDKGFSVDISIKGDIVGGSSRTVDFDIAKRTDIGLYGAEISKGASGPNWGFGIIPPLAGSAASADGAAFNNADDYYYDAAQVTVNTGTMNVSVATAVAAQNIGVNLLSQPLGALSVDVKGEPISVASITFQVSLVGEGANDDVDDITNAILVDETGTVVAGPVDGSATDSSGNEGTIPFTDTITFPTGAHTYTLKAKIGSDIDGGTTIAASTTPSGWGTVRGLTTSNTITPSPSSALNLPRMTVKSGALSVSVQSVPIAQSVIAGSSQFEFARYTFDATASGEDVRITTIPLAYGVAHAPTTGAANDLTGCKLYDGPVVVNSSNIVDPTAESSSTTFTFDGTGLTLTKGTAKTLSLKCNVRSGSTGAYLWGLDNGQQAAFTGATGVTSGQTIVETLTEANGQIMAASSGGTLTAVLDANSPGYKVVNAGATNVELARIRFSAANEDVDLRQVALQLTGTASNTANDLVGRRVTLWTTDGVSLGTAEFTTAQEDFATSSAIASGTFRITKDSSKVVVVKGDISNICNSCDNNKSGDFLKVDYDGQNVGINGNYGVGVASGSNISPSATDTSSSGVRIFRAYPELAHITLSSTEKTLTAGTTADKTLYKFSVM
ncbi:peptidoglycan-binding protein [Candidatus Giovannonibacteria bacterium]|nr:peptidoglycan-binding protein [Candidatus Giovannonibacteria bacterium]